MLGRHARPAAAATTITPSAAVGSGLISGIAKRRKNPAIAAATITAACDCAPAASLTAEREFEEETGKGASQAADDVRAASAVSSRFASTS